MKRLFRFCLPRTLLGAVLLLALLLSPALSRAQAAGAENALTPAQRAAVEAVVQDYLKRNPKVVLDALRALQERHASAQREETIGLLKANRREIESARGAFATNPARPVATVVEFFDYRCPYCKQMMPQVLKLMEDKPNVRVILREFPVLGPASETASRAALAALDQDPGKYLALHRALLSAQGSLTDEKIFEIASRVGLDAARLRAGMNDPSVTARIEETRKLADRLHLDGTPTFIIGDAVVPGAVDYGTLTGLIDQAAKTCATC
jgi:protein-disulfide isomerase